MNMGGRGARNSEEIRFRHDLPWSGEAHEDVVPVGTDLSRWQCPVTKGYLGWRIGQNDEKLYLVIEVPPRCERCGEAVYPTATEPHVCEDLRFLNRKD